MNGGVVIGNVAVVGEGRGRDLEEGGRGKEGGGEEGKGRREGEKEGVERLGGVGGERDKRNEAYAKR